ncbi:MAG TPA: glucose-1-phosphate thymidylyltransferase [Terriglobales bacterium]|nr:glucose-1-phosphate thymidylyltransferase [Terriglobales bacterium]
MKAIMLCAGLGTRLRPLTYSIAKHLIPVANKPVLYFGIENLIAVGIDQIGMIVSKESQPIIEGAVGDGSRWGIRIVYIEQDAPRGLAHACQCAESFVAGDDFVMYLGDNLIPEGLGHAVERFRSGADAVVMLKAVDDPRAFGIAQLDGERIVRLIEKPQDPPSNLAIVGGYVFSSEIFASIGLIKPSWRNELEITDAIQNLIDRNFKVLPYVMTSYWKDTGKPHDILDANQVMLDKLTPAQHGRVDSGSKIDGVAVIGEGAEVRNSKLIGPVIIGANAKIENATLGPYVSAGERVEVRNSTVRDCVIMEDTKVHDLSRPLVRSLIGRKAQITGQAEGEVRLIAGDMCDIAV